MRVSFRSTASYLEDCEHLLLYLHHKVVKTLGGLLTSFWPVLCCIMFVPSFVVINQSVNKWPECMYRQTTW